MAERSIIAMFPLTLLPLPGELVPLHIFEPRYRQLLEDAETTDISFGIFFEHPCNKRRIGALTKLESVVKRYPAGESDIVVRCIDTFSTDRLFSNYRNKRYPGGSIAQWHVDMHTMPGVALYELFIDFQSKRNINHHFRAFTLYQLAAELNLTATDRYRFLTLSGEKRNSFLMNHLLFQLHILKQVEKTRERFHLN